MYVSGSSAACVTKGLTRGRKKTYNDGTTTVGMVSIGDRSEEKHARLAKVNPERHPEQRGTITVTLAFFLEGDRPTEEDLVKVCARLVTIKGALRYVR
jgi:hypothetical protein